MIHPVRRGSDRFFGAQRCLSRRTGRSRAIRVDAQYQATDGLRRTHKSSSQRSIPIDPELADGISIRRLYDAHRSARVRQIWWFERDATRYSRESEGPPFRAAPDVSRWQNGYAPGPCKLGDAGSIPVLLYLTARSARGGPLSFAYQPFRLRVESTCAAPMTLYVSTCLASDNHADDESPS